MTTHDTPSSFPTRVLSALLALTLLAPFAGATADEAPVLGSLSDTSLPTSGRLLLFGTGFGAQAPTSQVLIDGQAAIATTWSATEIHAYVPAGASHGNVPVQVVTDAGASNALTLQVVPKSSSGRKLWTFEMDHATAGAFVATAADGTIYATDRVRLYALTPQGDLLWVYANTPDGGRPITVLPDGRVVVGFDGVQVLNPDGTLDWEYQPLGVSILAGPNVGPDGNIYVLSDAFVFGQGALSLDTSGTLLFNQTDPGFFNNQINNSAIVFNADTWYAGYDPTGGLPTLYALDFDGDVKWSASDLPWPVGSLPRVDPTGRVITGFGQTGVMAINNEPAIEWWTLHPDGANVIAMPAVGGDGTIYAGDWLGVDLWAVDPGGTTLWVRPSSSNFLGSISLTPDDALLLTSESGGFGATTNWVMAYDPADGSVVFEVAFPLVGGVTQSIQTREPGYSPSGDTAYVTTWFGGGGKAGELVAIDITTGGGPWTDLGNGLAGSTGVPSLTGSGSMAGGDAVGIALTGALARAPTTLVVGVAELGVPFKGGVMVPDPLVLVGGLLTDGAGALALGGTLPGSTPSGFTLVLQAWIADAAGPAGFAASNGVKGTTP